MDIITFHVLRKINLANKKFVGCDMVWFLNSAPIFICFKIARIGTDLSTVIFLNITRDGAQLGMKILLQPVVLSLYLRPPIKKKHFSFKLTTSISVFNI